MKLLSLFFFLIPLSCGEHQKDVANEETSPLKSEVGLDAFNLLSEAGNSFDFMLIENEFGQVTNIVRIVRSFEEEGSLSLLGDSEAEAETETETSAEKKVTIRFENYVIDVPKGYEPVYNDDGTPTLLGKKGSHGIVFQVNKILPDGTIEPWAMKYLYRQNEVLSKIAQWVQGGSEVEEEKLLVEQWKKFGNPIDIETFEGRNDIVMKTIVQGRTLKELVEQGTFFPIATGKVDKHSKDLQKGLRRLLLDISATKQVFDDLNPANIMYDYMKKRWVVIDSKLAEMAKSEKEALENNIKKFNSKVVYADGVDKHRIIHEQKKLLGTGKNTPDYTLRTFVSMVEFAESIENLKKPQVLESFLMKREDPFASDTSSETSSEDSFEQRKNSIERAESAELRVEKAKTNRSTLRRAKSR